MTASLFLAQPLFAAEAEINWVNPEKYDDLRAGDQNRKAFKEHTLKAFEKYFIQLADKLPNKQKLIINVHNIDLAGEIYFEETRQIRIIKESYLPKMTLSYKLLADNGNILTSGENKLKDMQFLQKRSLHYRNESLSYEKKMLDKWFQATFLT
jgi:hypothetical protein